MVKFVIYNKILTIDSISEKPLISQTTSLFEDPSDKDKYLKSWLCKLTYEKGSTKCVKSWKMRIFLLIRRLPLVITCSWFSNFSELFSANKRNDFLISKLFYNELQLCMRSIYSFLTEEIHKSGGRHD